MKILVMGLPGSGKTTLAKLLAPMFNAVYLNGKDVRRDVDDWDFSKAGRLKQAERMRFLAITEGEEKNRVVVADFVCPTNFTRLEFNADYTIYMDTIKESQFEDTNKIFEQPKKIDFQVKHKDAAMFSFLIKQDILDKHGNLGPHSK